MTRTTAFLGVVAIAAIAFIPTIAYSQPQCPGTWERTGTANEATELCVCRNGGIAIVRNNAFSCPDAHQAARDQEYIRSMRSQAEATERAALEERRAYREKQDSISEDERRKMEERRAAEEAARLREREAAQSDRTCPTGWRRNAMTTAFFERAPDYCECPDGITRFFPDSCPGSTAEPSVPVQTKEEAPSATRREPEDLRLEKTRNFSRIREQCRTTYNVAACALALASPIANDQDKKELTDWRAIAEQYSDNRVACEHGSPVACDAALASPALKQTDKTSLETWRAQATLWGRTLLAARDAWSYVAGFPVSTYVSSGLAAGLSLALAIVAYRKRERAVPDGTAATNAPEAKESLWPRVAAYTRAHWPMLLLMTLAALTLFGLFVWPGTPDRTVNFQQMMERTYFHDLVIPIALIIITLLILAWQRTRSKTILIPIAVIAVVFYFNIHVAISFPLIIVSVTAYVLYTWYPQVFAKLMRQEFDVQVADRPQDFRDLSATYNWWRPFAGKSLYISLALLAFPTIFLLNGEVRRGMPFTTFLVLFGFAFMWIFLRARSGHGMPRLISATKLPPVPPDAVGAGNMRVTLQRREAVYSTGPRSEMLLWLKFSESALAQITKSNLLGHVVCEFPLDRKTAAILREMGEDDQLEGNMWQIPLRNVLAQQPYLITQPNALALDVIEAQIETNLKALNEGLTNLAMRTDPSKTIDL